MPATAAPPLPVRKFVPVKIDLSDFEQIEPLYRALLERPLNSAEQIEKWLLDFSELSAAVDEYGSRRYIDKSCHTDDPELEKRFMDFVENVEPKIKPLYFELQKKLLDSPQASLLDQKRYFVLMRKWRADVEIFRDENVPLETQVTKLVNDYDKISGAMTVQFEGKERTMQQMARYQEQNDRAQRQAAWEAGTARRLVDREAIDTIFEQLLDLRQRIAVNANLSIYRDFAWKSNKRFDYTPEQCLDFADAIAATCVPLVKKLDEKRRRDLGLSNLRPFGTVQGRRNDRVYRQNPNHFRSAIPRAWRRV